MVELGISVKHSAFRLSNEDARKKQKLTKVWVCIVVVIMMPLCGLVTYASQKQQDEDAPRWIKVFYKLFLPTVFSMLTIGLGSASTYAVRNMRLYFDERLHGEITRIRTTFVTLTVAYMSRVICFIAVQILLSYGKPLSFTIAVIYYIGWFFWDVVPLTLIMSYQVTKVKRKVIKRTANTADSIFESDLTRTASLNPPPPLTLPEEDEVMFLGNPEYTELLL